MRQLVHQIAIGTRDPGLARLGHALKTIGGVVLAYLIIHALGLSAMTLGLTGAGILAQCTVGNSSRQRKASMAIAGFGGGSLAMIGAMASHHNVYAGYVWMLVVVLVAYMLARLEGRWAVMPRFVVVLVIFGTMMPTPIPEIGGVALSYVIGFASAFVVYFYVLPEHKLPLLQSSLHLAFGRIADLIETQEKRSAIQEANRLASEMLDGAQKAMQEARNAGWNQGDLVDSASELVLILRELYIDGRFMQRFLAHMRQGDEVPVSHLFFAAGREATRGMRAAGVAVNVASHRSTLPVYDAVANIRQTLQDLVGSFEEGQIATKMVSGLIRASNFVAGGQNFCTSLERAAELIDRLQHPNMPRGS